MLSRLLLCPLPRNGCPVCVPGAPLPFKSWPSRSQFRATEKRENISTMATLQSPMHAGSAQGRLTMVSRCLGQRLGVRVYLKKDSNREGTRILWYQRGGGGSVSKHGALSSPHTGSTEVAHGATCSCTVSTSVAPSSVPRRTMPLFSGGGELKRTHSPSIPRYSLCSILIN